MATHPTTTGFPGPVVSGRTRNGAGPLSPAAAPAGEDRELAGRASRGDPQAFERLVRRHSALVYRVALRILGPAGAQDASQEVWVKVWRNIKSFRGDSAFTTWLYRVTTNTCLTGRDREARRRELQEREAPLPPDPRGGGDDPEAAALNSERREEIEEALGRIRADHRAALVLRHMEGLSYAEVAEVLGVPDGTAKGWASRGRAAMFVMLSDPAYGGGIIGSPRKAG